MSNDTFYNNSPNKRVKTITVSDFVNEITDIKKDINEIKNNIKEIKQELENIKIFVGMKYKKFDNTPSYIY